MVHSGAGATPTTDLTAGVHTPVVDQLTDLVTAAVSVLLALHLGAAQGSVGVAHVLGLAPALGPVAHHEALSVGAAPRSVTRVDTLPVAASISSTGQIVSTVSVGPTLIGILTSSTVGVSDQSSWTGALE